MLPHLRITTNLKGEVNKNVVELCTVWFRECGTVLKTGGWAEGGRDEDDEIISGCQDGKD